VTVSERSDEKDALTMTNTNRKDADTVKRKTQTYHEIVNHLSAKFWVAEAELDQVLENYNDELLHPRSQWLRRTGRTKVE
jgi:hypothetical protein